MGFPEGMTKAIRFRSGTKVIRPPEGQGETKAIRISRRWRPRLPDLRRWRLRLSDLQSKRVTTMLSDLQRGLDKSIQSEAVEMKAVCTPPVYKRL
ncbi:hypothetical protein AVEN_20003-1 [Araneus ventricosus]|uniref:Uncharacterized protein n=1 Tax=Araneus ventricosus TaxID=182803 RepID=A0A4Y2I5S6_ARAVE|nr:hypothetical protein AVEN_20003-1 [Araneus ventricosus]